MLIIGLHKKEAPKSFPAFWCPEHEKARRSDVRRNHSTDLSESRAPLAGDKSSVRF